MTTQHSKDDAAIAAIREELEFVNLAAAYDGEVAQVVWGDSSGRWWYNRGLQQFNDANASVRTIDWNQPQRFDTEAEAMAELEKRA